ncbi:uncharacterized protein LOC114075190 [Solanum pennellii]|uniref:Uncharacterized protein LOC114075190 n=1 Tax=Solanum pennellii TaxID=28526 RepID=A0ABM1V0N1_SOLPN|nr:uncharacterized protein LOC114075190 [Solanum pennellii]
MQMVNNKFLYFKTFLPVDNLLRLSHNLKNLMIFSDMSYLASFKRKNIDLLVEKYLSFEQNIFKVSLQNLKSDKVMPLCSRTRSFHAIKPHQFLKFLLEHAINLEKLVIVPEHKECNGCSTNTSNLIKHLLAFPTSAIISF